MPRLEALKILQANADAAAVELALPMLRDTNSVIRKRAFAFFRYISGQNLSQDNPAKWEQWWATNQTTFAGKKCRPLRGERNLRLPMAGADHSIIAPAWPDSHTAKPNPPAGVVRLRGWEPVLHRQPRPARPNTAQTFHRQCAGTGEVGCR